MLIPTILHFNVSEIITKHLKLDAIRKVFTGDYNLAIKKGPFTYLLKNVNLEGITKIVNNISIVNSLLTSSE